MTFDEVVKVLGALSSAGVLAGGVGIFKWAWGMERRVLTLELRGGIKR